MTGDVNLMWTDPAWKREAESWIQAHLRDAGIETSGPINQFHVRPWSTVLEIPTEREPFYFKALPEALRHEVAVMEYLMSRFPDRVPQVFAADPARGWMLLQEGGEILRRRLGGRPSVQEWYQVLEAYAEIQTGSVPYAEELRTLGVPDRRPRNLPSLLTDLLGNPGALHLDEPDGLSETALAELREERPKFEFLCEQLADGPVPHTIEHGDLHDANVFWSQRGPVIFDWADCSIAHPFFSLRPVSVSLVNTLGWDEDDLRLQDLRGRYLGHWTDWAPLSVLRKTFRAAAVVAPLVAALRWERALRTLPEGQDIYVDPIPRLLVELLSNLRGQGEML